MRLRTDTKVSSILRLIDPRRCVWSDALDYFTATATQQGNEEATDTTTVIRPFHVNVPEAQLAELRRRINATQCPERETGRRVRAGRSGGPAFAPGRRDRLCCRRRTRVSDRWQAAGDGQG